MAPVIGLVGLGLFERGFPSVSNIVKIFSIGFNSFTTRVQFRSFAFIHKLYEHICIVVLQLGNCVEIGIPMLLLVIGLSQVSVHL